MQNAPVKQFGIDLHPDDEFKQSKLLSLATWNIQGKAASEAMVVLEDCLHDYNIISLQEVSGCIDVVSKGSYCFGGEVGPGSTCLYAWPTDCFRPVAVAFDTGIGWDRVFVGHSHVSVRLHVQGLSKPLIWVCAHLPHMSRPVEDLARAVDSLQQDIQPWVDRGSPIVLAGDLNYPLVEDVSHRSQMVQQMCALLGLTMFSFNSHATRSSGVRRLDHIVTNQALQQQCLCQEMQVQSSLEHAFESYCWDVQVALGCDHAAICWEMLVLSGGPKPVSYTHLRAHET